jgi:uncharacterized protein (DUF1499 family)|tara:strand:+ start:3044 stop:3520 length:477 start_codon:yes stop_codon:yes gene_type:complete
MEINFDSLTWYELILLLSLIGYIVMIGLISLLSPTKIWDSFPKKCAVKTKCTRVADYNCRGYNLKPIVIEESVNSVQKKIMEIIYSKPRMKIINENVGFIHATDVTPFFRFYDDLAIKIFEQEGKTIVWMQSQSRLGYYDFQVNEKRIQQLHKEFLLL